jgi:hypothetical protein
VTITFLQRAKFTAKYGIPIVPALPGFKFSTIKGWPKLATTDMAQLEQWNEENPDFNAISVPKYGQVLILDIDDPTILKLLPQDLPASLKVSTPSGGYHAYYLATPESDALGNRNVLQIGDYFVPDICDHKKKTPLLELKAHDKTAAAPYSITEKGGYKPFDKSALCPIPEWLVDWVDEHSIHAKKEVSFHEREVSEEFDFDDFCEFFDIEYFDEGTHWFTTPICPYSGIQHTQSRRTGFYWDGKRFGFHCFADGCDDPDIGDLIRKLNEENGESYRGEIWPGFNRNSEIDLSNPKWGGIDEVDDGEEKEPRRVPIPTIASSPKEEKQDAPHVVATAVAAPVILRPTPFIDDYTDGIEDLVEPHPTVLEFPNVEVKNDEFLPFPFEAMYGRLRQLAENMNVPYGFAYPALLTIACGLDIEDAGGNVRGTLYTALLGGVNYGKTIVSERAKNSIFLPESIVDEGVPGSDRGLIKDIGTEGRRKVFYQDELRSLLSKCGINGSSLTPLLCKLWSSDHGAASDKRGRDECHGVISVLGNLAVEDPSEFAKIMGAETTKGLSDRMVYGIGPVVDFYPATIKPQLVKVKPCLVPRWCYPELHKWSDGDRNKRRVGEIALRVALIQSAVNGDQEVTNQSFQCALNFADWQVSIRAVYRAGVAENKEAEAFEAIATALQQVHDKQEHTSKIPNGGTETADLHWARIMNSKSLYRKHGSTVINRIKMSMVHEGILRIVYDLDDEGNPTKKATPFVQLRGRIK